MKRHNRPIETLVLLILRPPPIHKNIQPQQTNNGEKPSSYTPLCEDSPPTSLQTQPPLFTTFRPASLQQLALVHPLAFFSFSSLSSAFKKLQYLNKQIPLTFQRPVTGRFVAKHSPSARRSSRLFANRGLWPSRSGTAAPVPAWSEAGERWYDRDQGLAVLL